MNAHTKAALAAVAAVLAACSGESNAQHNSNSAKELATSSAAGLDGYTWCADENGTCTFSQLVDLAYGANGYFNYKVGFTGTITFNNATLGDPLLGVAKAGYFRVSAIQPIKVMPLGDSITDGLYVPGGYRIELWNRIVSMGYLVDFVGSQINGPVSLGDINHEGHPGWRIDQIDAQINGWMDAYGPQIVLLHIGTNDVNADYDLPNAPARLSALIDKICAKLPFGGKVYVAKLTPLGDSGAAARLQTYNDQIPGIVQSKAGEGKPVFLVDMFSAMTAADLVDGIHPSAAGYSSMGDVWYEAIKSNLSAPLTGLVHEAEIGDQPLSAGVWAGTKGQSRSLEGFQVALSSAVDGLGIEYMCHLAGLGDQPWMAGGSYCGTRGETRNLEGLAIRLTGANAGNYEVSYSCHVQEIGDVGPVTNGAFCGTRGQSKRVEAIEVFVKKVAP